MADPATYQAYSFKAVSTDDLGPDRVVVGNVRWRLAPHLTVADYMPLWESSGYKTGLNIPDTQTVRQFSYADVAGGQIVMVAGTAAEAAVLGATLGVQTGYTWFVFENPAARVARKFSTVPGEPHTVEFSVTLTLANKNANREVFGAASRHMGASFSAGSTNSLWAIPPAPYSAP